MKRVFAVFFSFFLFSHICYSAVSEEHVIRSWLEKVGDGIYDLKQVLFPSHSSFEYVFSFPEMRDPPEDHFLNFIRATDGVISCWDRASGDQDAAVRGFFFDTKRMKKEVISKVLNRRHPIINRFAYDHEKYEGDDPRYICLATPGSAYDYLGLIWLRLVIMLSVSEDYRFRLEATNLLSYISSPPDLSKCYDNKDREAFYCFSGNTRRELPRFLRAYISFCQKK